MANYARNYIDLPKELLRLHYEHWIELFKTLAGNSNPLFALKPII